MTQTIIDYITGKEIPDQGPEGSRQLFEKFLVQERGYTKTDVKVDHPITVTFQGAPYHSLVDIVVFCQGKPLMAVRCVAGSLASFEREILAAARLLYPGQIPFSVSTDGKDALVRDVVSGKLWGTGLDAVFNKEEGLKRVENFSYPPFPENRKDREMIIFRSYDIERRHNDCTNTHHDTQ
ncbi:MAG: type I restriction enzyme HsdR N-terminal domain-containing protein [Desulfamplus sp.]|nr:type I restriction enzyme HsdR N-terminal domain-containing protein [Desulfamplus sp.]